MQTKEDVLYSSRFPAFAQIGLLNQMYETSRNLSSPSYQRGSAGHIRSQTTTYRGRQGAFPASDLRMIRLDVERR